MARRKIRRGFGSLSVQTRCGHEYTVAEYPFPIKGRDMSGKPYGVLFASELAKSTRKRYKRTFAVGQTAEAEAWLAGEKRLIDGGTWAPPSSRREEGKRRTILFHDYAQQYVHSRRKPNGEPIARTTLMLYERHLRDLDATFGKTPITDITTGMIHAWYDSEAPKAKGQGERVRENRATLLKAILHHAATVPVDQEGHTLINRSPFDFTPLKARRHHKYVIATPEQIKAMADNMSAPHALAIFIAGFMGLREGEVLALRRSDIDLTEGRECLSVQGSVKDIPDSQGHSHAVVGKTKTAASVRTVRIPSALVPLFRAQEKWMAKGPDALLFTRNRNRDPRPILPQDFRNEFYGARERTGIAAIQTMHFHDLRHTAISTALAEGATQAQLRAFGGHSTESASLVYQQSTQAADQRLSSRLDDLYSGALGQHPRHAQEPQGASSMEAARASAAPIPRPTGGRQGIAKPPAGDEDTGAKAQALAQVLSGLDGESRSKVFAGLDASLAAKVAMALAMMGQQ